MVPAPPALFSTYTDWPSCVVSSCATERATISELPPGAKGTTKRIGFEGHAWALAANGKASARPNAAMALRGKFIESSCLVLVAPEAAIDGIYGPGDVAGARRGEEHRQVRELLGLAVSSHG